MESRLATDELLCQARDGGRARYQVCVQIRVDSALDFGYRSPTPTVVVHSLENCVQNLGLGRAVFTGRVQPKTFGMTLSLSSCSLSVDRQAAYMATELRACDRAGNSIWPSIPIWRRVPRAKTEGMRFGSCSPLHYDRDRISDSCPHICYLCAMCSSRSGLLQTRNAADR